MDDALAPLPPAGPAVAAARQLAVLIAAPRGFCAGVDRAIRVVEQTIERHGSPVFVRHEIVHNRYVVQQLEARGAVFVEELDQVPDGRPVVFSAHGVPKVVVGAAVERGLDYVDATCPLVSKVHRQAERAIREGRHILFIGHRGHPEVVGTLGQVPAGTMTLVETEEDARTVAVPDADRLAYLTQTTLSIDDTVGIIAALVARFPAIAAPPGEDICYATSNRQAAAKLLARQCDAVIVIGAPNSSNSLRLVEVAHKEGVRSILIQRAADLDLGWLDGVATLGVTAGASAPECLVRELIAHLSAHFALTERELDGIVETTTFKLPRSLRVA